MLKQRVITAICLAVILFLILYSQSKLLFGLFLMVFFGAGAWENARLFHGPIAWLSGVISAIFFALVAAFVPTGWYPWCAIIAVVIWVCYLIPSLGRELPPAESFGEKRYQFLYWFSVLCSFLSILVLYNQSLIYLLSVMVIVWLADIGAYFSGRAFGRNKLAPTISPGKTWEGVVGGAIAVLIYAFLVLRYAPDAPTIVNAVFARFGWAGLIVCMLVLTGFSVIGDLLESKLKRRRGIKDSSNLLPGHGGVLDRIDALIPVLPLSVLLGLFL